MKINENLIKLCKAQDRKAQETVYTLLYQDAFRIASRYVKSDEDAKDVMNEAFFTIFTKIDQFQGDANNFQSWIKRIIVNRCLDYLRSAAFKYATLPLEQIDNTLSVENQHQALEFNIITFIQKLPFTTSAVFNLYVMEGYSHKEISELLDITESNSKYHLHSARQKLKNMLFKSEIQ